MNNNNGLGNQIARGNPSEKQVSAPGMVQYVLKVDGNDTKHLDPQSYVLYLGDVSKQYPTQTSQVVWMQNQHNEVQVLPASVREQSHHNQLRIPCVTTDSQQLYQLQTVPAQFREQVQTLGETVNGQYILQIEGNSANQLDPTRPYFLYLGDVSKQFQTQSSEFVVLPKQCNEVQVLPVSVGDHNQLATSGLVTSSQELHNPFVTLTSAQVQSPVFSSISEKGYRNENNKSAATIETNFHRVRSNINQEQVFRCPVPTPCPSSSQQLQHQFLTVTGSQVIQKIQTPDPSNSHQLHHQYLTVTGGQDVNQGRTPGPSTSQQAHHEYITVNSGQVIEQGQTSAPANSQQSHPEYITVTGDQAIERSRTPAPANSQLSHHECITATDGQVREQVQTPGSLLHSEKDHVNNNQMTSFGGDLDEEDRTIHGVKTYDLIPKQSYRQQLVQTKESPSAPPAKLSFYQQVYSDDSDSSVGDSVETLQKQINQLNDSLEKLIRHKQRKRLRKKEIRCALVEKDLENLIQSELENCDSHIPEINKNNGTNSVTEETHPVSTSDSSSLAANASSVSRGQTTIEQFFQSSSINHSKSPLATKPNIPKETKKNESIPKCDIVILNNDDANVKETKMHKKLSNNNLAISDDDLSSDKLCKLSANKKSNKKKLVTKKKVKNVKCVTPNDSRIVIKSSKVAPIDIRHCSVLLKRMQSKDPSLKKSKKAKQTDTETILTSTQLNEDLPSNISSINESDILLLENETEASLPCPSQDLFDSINNSTNHPVEANSSSSLSDLRVNPLHESSAPTAANESNANSLTIPQEKCLPMTNNEDSQIIICGQKQNEENVPSPALRIENIQTFQILEKKSLSKLKNDKQESRTFKNKPNKPKRLIAKNLLETQEEISLSTLLSSSNSCSSLISISNDNEELGKESQVQNEVLWDPNASIDDIFENINVSENCSVVNINPSVIVDEQIFNSAEVDQYKDISAHSESQIEENRVTSPCTRGSPRDQTSEDSVHQALSSCQRSLNVQETNHKLHFQAQKENRNNVTELNFSIPECEKETRSALEVQQETDIEVQSQLDETIPPTPRFEEGNRAKSLLQCLKHTSSHYSEATKNKNSTKPKDVEPTSEVKEKIHIYDFEENNLFTCTEKDIVPAIEDQTIELTSAKGHKEISPPAATVQKPYQANKFISSPPIQTRKRSDTKPALLKNTSCASHIKENELTTNSMPKSFQKIDICSISSSDDEHILIIDKKRSELTELVLDTNTSIQSTSVENVQSSSNTNNIERKPQQEIEPSSSSESEDDCINEKIFFVDDDPSSLSDSDNEETPTFCPVFSSASNVIREIDNESALASGLSDLENDKTAQRNNEDVKKVSNQANSLTFLTQAEDESDSDFEKEIIQECNINNQVRTNDNDDKLEFVAKPSVSSRKFVRQVGDDSSDSDSDEGNILECKTSNIVTTDDNNEKLKSDANPDLALKKCVLQVGDDSSDSDSDEGNILECKTSNIVTSDDNDQKLKSDAYPDVALKKCVLQVGDDSSDSDSDEGNILECKTSNIVTSDDNNEKLKSLANTNVPSTEVKVQVGDYFSDSDSDVESIPECSTNNRVTTDDNVERLKSVANPNVSLKKFVRQVGDESDSDSDEGNMLQCGTNSRVTTNGNGYNGGASLRKVVHQAAQESSHSKFARKRRDGCHAKWPIQSIEKENHAALHAAQSNIAALVSSLNNKKSIISTQQEQLLSVEEDNTVDDERLSVELSDIRPRTYEVYDSSDSGIRLDSSASDWCLKRRDRESVSPSRKLKKRRNPEAIVISEEKEGEESDKLDETDKKEEVVERYLVSISKKSRRYFNRSESDSSLSICTSKRKKKKKKGKKEIDKLSAFSEDEDKSVVGINVSKKQKKKKKDPSKCSDEDIKTMEDKNSFIQEDSTISKVIPDVEDPASSTNEKESSSVINESTSSVKNKKKKKTIKTNYHDEEITGSIITETSERILNNSKSDKKLKADNSVNESRTDGDKLNKRQTRSASKKIESPKKDEVSDSDHGSETNDCFKTSGKRKLTKSNTEEITLKKRKITDDKALSKKKKKTNEEPIEQDLLKHLPSHFLKDLSQVKPSRRSVEIQQQKSGQRKEDKQSKWMVTESREKRDFIPLKAKGATRFCVVPLVRLEHITANASVPLANFKQNAFFDGNRVKRAAPNALNVLAKKRSAANF